MKQFQTVLFQNINEFLAFLPQEELNVLEQLREIVLNCIPDVKEKLAYNVPFYYRHSRICFIWPGSVQWGKTEKKGVELGFCKGYLLSDPSYLEKGGRKEVFIKTFYKAKEVDADTVAQLIYEAVVIDEHEHRTKQNLRR